MSEQINFDRRKGFVALPVEVLDYDLTPGAFRTLAELCRMANADGFCWPSLEQLSDRLGRSRSAISGYVAELRAAGLVATQEQKTANGYNYRLKYEVTFWQAWRSSLTGAARAQPERGVRPAERLVESKNQSHENQCGRDFDAGLDDLVKAWAQCFAGAPYPLARHAPPVRLCEETLAVLARTRPETVAPDAITAALSALWTSLAVDADAPALAAQRRCLEAMKLTSDELGKLRVALARDWPAHWRKCPSPEGFAKRVRAAGIATAHARLTLLEGYHKRWLRAEKTLRKQAPSCSVAA